MILQRKLIQKVEDCGLKFDKGIERGNKKGVNVGSHRPPRLGSGAERIALIFYIGKSSKSSLGVSGSSCFAPLTINVVCFSGRA